MRLQTIINFQFCSLSRATETKTTFSVPYCASTNERERSIEKCNRIPPLNGAKYAKEFSFVDIKNEYSRRLKTTFFICAHAFEAFNYSLWIGWGKNHPPGLMPFNAFVLPRRLTIRAQWNRMIENLFSGKKSFEWENVFLSSSVDVQWGDFCEIKIIQIKLNEIFLKFSTGIWIFVQATKRRASFCLKSHLFFSLILIKIIIKAYGKLGGFSLEIALISLKEIKIKQD